MAKKTKEESTLKFSSGDKLLSHSEELDDKLQSGYDATKDLLLNPRWDGEYYIRILPILDGHEEDWMLPMGIHWNIIPKTADDKTQPLACPRYTWGEECPICDAIDRLISERRRSYKDFGMDGNGYNVQKRLLLRVLLTDYQPVETTQDAPKFDFSHGPLLRIISIPPGTVGKNLNKKLRNPKFGHKALLAPDTGKLIMLTRSKNVQNYWQVDLLDPMSLTEEEMRVPEWTDMKLLLPKERYEEVYKIVQKHQNDLDPDVVNYALAQDVLPPAAGYAQIEASEEKPDLKETLDNI